MEEIRNDLIDNIIKSRNEEKDIFLYRVITLEQFLFILMGDLKSKSHEMQNTLVRPWMWEDPFEKMLDDKSVHFNKARWFGQCWSLEEESDSIWRSFTQNRKTRCVKIKVSIKNLRESLHSVKDSKARFILSPLAYINEEDIKETAKVISKFSQFANGVKELEKPQFVAEITLLLSKRYQYKSENEVRLLVYVKGEKKEKKTWSYPFDVNRYVDEVVFDPDTPDYYQNNYIELLGRLGLENVDKKVRFSNLYAHIDAKKLFSKEV